MGKLISDVLAALKAGADTSNEISEMTGFPVAGKRLTYKALIA
jgi:hypothetical protein